ncbi:Aldo keto reductase [Coniophora puteana RWD-64-598 SS2]|uniref:Aldo keto reductase n=1 Tax=Coniophora puteana (strain RWD-64-598) TaxID=741705 RepID=A0A5M3MTI0_CONPW|nr:Aldo keto reductase [Coniophora puteana RWD-64-598 SS2]EIW82468.1 Aldo keto reductase [Coniophora puteana RWD-64-598 SS2]
MVERLDAPQPTYPLPPLSDIPDGEEDKPADTRILTTKLGAFDWPGVVLGAAAFSGFYSTNEQMSSVTPLRTTRLALRYGIRAFDTSPYYGPSEIILGTALNALKDEFPRSSYIIATKCGRFGSTRNDFDYTPAGVRASVKRSLARLHTDYLDVVYVHDVEFIATPVSLRTRGCHLGALGAEKEVYGLLEGQEATVHGPGDQELLAAISELQKLKEEGVVKNIGISGYSLPTLLRLALLVLHTSPLRPLDAILSYSHLNLQNRSLEQFAPVFYERAKIKHVSNASPFSMGLILPSPPPWHPASQEVKDAVAIAVQKSSAWEGYGGIADLALGYAYRRGIASNMPTVTGLKNLEEVHETMKIWYDVLDDSSKRRQERVAHEEELLEVFREHNLLDVSWETPAFKS